MCPVGDVATMVVPWQHCATVFRRCGQDRGHISSVKFKPNAILSEKTQREDMLSCLGFGPRNDHIMPHRLPQYIVEFTGGSKYQFIFGYGY